VRFQRAPRADVAFNADGTRVAVTSGSMIRVVNAATGEAVAQFDRRDADDGDFQEVAFSPDSRTVVAGSSGLGGPISVFEIESRSLVRRFSTHLGPIHRLVLFPDGTRAASAGADEAITLWDLTAREGIPK
jgi:WD40 repeat protein